MTLLERLQEHQGGYLSGSDLAAALGISRAAVWKQVEALRAQGYQIEARTRLGYRLVSAPFGAGGLELPDRLGQPLHIYPSLPSTNTTAKEFAQGGAAEGLTVFAEQQTAGRGRLGRDWRSEPGVGLYFSVLLRPALAPAQVALVTLLAAVATCEAIEGLTPLTPRIKWPNDLLLGTKKCAGILTDLTAEGEQVTALILGIGLNVNQVSWPPELAGVATSLAAELGHPVDREALFSAILSRLAYWYDELLAGRAAALLAAWRQRSATLGQPVAVRDPWGKLLAEGLATDIGGDGALIITTPEGTQRVVAGEVTLRSK